MTVKHFGSGDYRIRYNQGWNELAYIYFDSLAIAHARISDYYRYSGMGAVRVEWFNGEAWVV